MGFLKPKTPDRPKDDKMTPAQLASQARRQRALNAGAATTTVAGSTVGSTTSTSGKPTLGDTV